MGRLKGAWTERKDLTLLWVSLTWWCRASSGLGFSQSRVPQGSEPAWCSSSTSTRLPPAVPEFNSRHLLVMQVKACCKSVLRGLPCVCRKRSVWDLHLKQPKSILIPGMR